MYSQNYEVILMDENQQQNIECPTNRIKYVKSYDDIDDDMETDAEDIIIYCPEEIDDSEPENETDIILDVDMAVIKNHLASAAGQQKNNGSMKHPPLNSAVTASIMRPTTMQPPTVPLPIQHIINRKPIKDEHYLALLDEIEKIEIQNADIQKMFKKEEIKGDGTITGLKLPFRTVADINRFEAILEEDDTKKYIWQSTFKNLWKGTVEESMPLLVADNVLRAYKWDGSNQGYKSLSKFKLFNTILFVAWKSDDLSYSQYVHQIKAYLRTAHNRLRLQATNNKDLGDDHQYSKLSSAAQEPTKKEHSWRHHENSKPLEDSMNLTARPLDDEQYSILLEQIATVQRQNEEIKNSLLDLLEGDTSNTLEHYNLPLNIEEDRHALERILKDDRKKYNLIKILSKLRDENENIDHTFNLILTDKFITKYNWEGIRGDKHGLSQLTLFKTILYDVWKSKFPDHDDFVLAVKKFIRHCQHRASNRVYIKKKKTRKPIEL